MACRGCEWRRSPGSRWIGPADSGLRDVPVRQPAHRHPATQRRERSERQQLSGGSAASADNSAAGAQPAPTTQRAGDLRWRGPPGAGRQGRVGPGSSGGDPQTAVSAPVTGGAMNMWPGSPYPLGASYDGGGTNFAIFSEVAERVELCLFDETDHETRIDLPEREALVWHGYLPRLTPGQR